MDAVAHMLFDYERQRARPVALVWLSLSACGAATALGQGVFTGDFSRSWNWQQQFELCAAFTGLIAIAAAAALPVWVVAHERGDDGIGLFVHSTPIARRTFLVAQLGAMLAWLAPLVLIPAILFGVAAICDPHTRHDIAGFLVLVVMVLVALGVGTATATLTRSAIGGIALAWTALISIFATAALVMDASWWTRLGILSVTGALLWAIGFGRRLRGAS